MIANLALAGSNLALTLRHLREGDRNKEGLFDAEFTATQRNLMTMQRRLRRLMEEDEEEASAQADRAEDDQ